MSFTTNQYDLCLPQLDFVASPTHSHTSLWLDGQKGGGNPVSSTETVKMRTLECRRRGTTCFALKNAAGLRFELFATCSLPRTLLTAAQQNGTRLSRTGGRLSFRMLKETCHSSGGPAATRRYRMVCAEILFETTQTRFCSLSNFQHAHGCACYRSQHQRVRVGSGSKFRAAYTIDFYT